MSKENRQSPYCGHLSSARVVREHEHRRRQPSQREPDISHRRQPGQSVPEVPADLIQPLRERIPRSLAPPRRSGRAWRNRLGPADTEIDPARIRRTQCGKLLRHHQRLVVRQLHTARAQPDPVGPCSQDRGEHGRAGTAAPPHSMVFRKPEAAIAEVIGSLGNLSGLPERGRRGLAGQLRYDVEHRVS